MKPQWVSDFYEGSKFPPLVEVIWYDICSAARWREDDEPLGLAQCVTMGYLLERGKKVVRIASSLNSGGQNGDVTTIPRSCVRYIMPLFRAR